MNPDPSSIRTRAKNILIEGSFPAVLWLIRKLRVAGARVVINASMHCRVACFVEVWFRVADGKPVDTKSPLYDEVSNAIDYYLTRPPKRGAPPGAFEEITLAHIYLKPDREEPNLTTKRRLYAFVHKFKVANIIREF